MQVSRSILTRIRPLNAPRCAIAALRHGSRYLPVTARPFYSQGNGGIAINSHPTGGTSDTLIYPEAPTTAHSDLASFLDYARRTGLDTASTTFVGTHFEYMVASALLPFGFCLHRVGGQSDHGIDLLGTWSVPSAVSQPLRVLLQCKASKKPGPHLVRELEGAFVGAPSGWRGSGVLGLLVIDRPATKGMRDAVGRSRWPMGCISCSRIGKVEQILWNRRAEEEGLAGMGVGTRYSSGEEETQHLVLTFKGKQVGVVKSD